MMGTDDRTDIHSDPANYRRNSEPFATVDDSNEALMAFFDEVSTARDRHRIVDVAVLCEVMVLVDGKEVCAQARIFLGDSARSLPMIAREFGAAQQRYEDEIASIVESARKARR
jgi:hypothetical protein